ncbi:flagellar hook-length control protein FliK [Thalassobacillus cyri]|uniref:Flagellar hook-length control protein FliK n=1 Tax=Thalassobacillus cyri TaxID=571932 RepID=A0A1H4G3K2_9BACI|nr:flagellar hook-length control protein FliK [Thalassobacillus cyri]SEB03282.1 flagellar hook-length control protein FliK [Thalassobacillus cyri]
MNTNAIKLAFFTSSSQNGKVQKNTVPNGDAGTFEHVLAALPLEKGEGEDSGTATPAGMSRQLLSAIEDSQGTEMTDLQDKLQSLLPKAVMEDFEQLSSEISVEDLQSLKLLIRGDNTETKEQSAGNHIFFPAPLSLASTPATGTAEGEVMEQENLTLAIHIKDLIQQAQQWSGSGTSRTQFGTLPKQLLQSLEQWIAQQNGSNSTSQQAAAQGQKVANISDEPLLRDLIKWYQSRTAIQNQAYQSQSQVTTKDMTKWLQHALNRYSADDKGTKQQTSLPTGALTKVEQFMIHIDQNKSTEGMQKQMMQEFDRVLKSSNLQLLKNGSMEMQLKLRPAQLGDVVVKMTQLNGEMAVKIIVTSQAAKEMLEGNMQQLRHMFSPQQVVVEKADMNTAQQQFQSKDQQTNGSDEQSRQQHTAKRQDREEENNENEDSFQEILLNEKV